MVCCTKITNFTILLSIILSFSSSLPFSLFLFLHSHSSPSLYFLSTTVSWFLLSFLTISHILQSLSLSCSPSSLIIQSLFLLFLMVSPLSFFSLFLHSLFLILHSLFWFLYLLSPSHSPHSFFTASHILHSFFRSFFIISHDIQSPSLIPPCPFSLLHSSLFLTSALLSLFSFYSSLSHSPLSILFHFSPPLDFFPFIFIFCPFLLFLTPLFLFTLMCNSPFPLFLSCFSLPTSSLFVSYLLPCPILPCPAHICTCPCIHTCACKTTQHN